LVFYVKNFGAWLERSRPTRIARWITFKEFSFLLNWQTGLELSDLFKLREKILRTKL
jgi:hypothetical protein